MWIIFSLLGLSLISSFIPHKDTKYNLSWHTRLLTTITMIYILGYFVYSLITIFI